jgi:dTDP-4-amino-4,6-dideoxygalactose transaminase
VLTEKASAVIPVSLPWLGPEEAAAAADAVASGWVAQGPRVAAFEHEFAARVVSRHAVAVSSGTAGLHMALVALGIGPGDEVIVPSLSFIATANAVRYVGATPVFADVDPTTLNLVPETIEPRVTSATRAVLLVHQAGIPADIDAIARLCSARDIALVEDAACAIGSTLRGVPIGGHSDLVVFSFHPRKVLTTGEGGMVTTPRDDWAQRLRRLRDHGMSVSASDRHESTKPVFEQYLETAFNYRMTDIQAAVGRVQLSRLAAILVRRRALGTRYQARLADIPGLVTAQDPPHATTNYQSFWVTLPDGFPMSRDALLQAMMNEGISPRRGIMAAHLEPAYLGHPHGPLPHTERLSRQSLILPLYPQMTEEQQDRVIAVLRRAAGMSPRPQPVQMRDGGWRT